MLNNFREELSSRQLYTRLRSFLAEHRTMELRDMYKEVGTWNSTIPGGFVDPSPVVDDPITGYGGASTPGFPRNPSNLYHSRHF